MKMEYKIGGITVQFPYKAYGPQLAYMSKVVATLEQSRLRVDSRCNALLESPTGSGKSLALLCSTLAWQQHYKGILGSKSTAAPGVASIPDSSGVRFAGGGFIVEDTAAGLEPENGNCTGSFQQMPGMAPSTAQIKPKAPRIFYATRTHAQITQVIREFRKTGYRVPMAVLAAKKHYCTNKQVQKKKNVDEDCLVLLRGEQIGCRFFKNAARVKSHASIQRGGSKDIHDIEDLVAIGHSVKGCAYFAARAMAMEAEIVFCPYSYIVDPIIREAVEADIRGSIIIFDEAHNIEDVAREAGSVDLETSVLSDMQFELQQLKGSEKAPDYCQPLLDMIQDLLAWTDYQANHLTKVEYEHHSSWWTGDKALHELREAGIPIETFEILLSFSKKAVAAATDDKESHLSARLVNSLERLFRVLQFMLSNNGRKAVDYQLVVQKFTRRDKASYGTPWVVSFSLWCLNPAVVFEEISSASRSIIVTSGTLAPIASFASELGVNFDVRIEAPHVVDMETQVWASALSVGPREVVLNASYKNAENFLFQDAVGAALLEIFKVTPDGVLVFLPSYKLLTKLCDRWQSTGLWLVLASHKRLFVEPRSNDEKFESVLKGYYEAIRGLPQLGTEKSKKKKGKLNGPPGACNGNNSANGAAFLAVCRGKVSEGIDFSDGNARAVVVIGIPFPNVKDIQVSLKKQYNTTHQVTKNLLSGDQWYCQQAFRALNQAVGRCIRHRYDYGGIILLDERFKASRNLEYMSKWLRKSIRQSDNFHASMSYLKDFFTRSKELEGQTSMQSPGSDVKTLPELSIPVHKKGSSPITSVPIIPITPLKSECVSLRISSTTELCTKSETLVNVHDNNKESLSDSLCLRSGLLPQFDATETEPWPTPGFCLREHETSSSLRTQAEPEFLTQPFPRFQRPPVSSIGNGAVNQATAVGVRLGHLRSAAAAANRPDDPAEINNASEPDENTVSIVDDDGALYTSRDFFDPDEDLASPSDIDRTTTPKNLNYDVGNSELNEGHRGGSPSAQDSAAAGASVSPLHERQHVISSGCADGRETSYNTARPEQAFCDPDGSRRPTMNCNRCGLMLGIISCSQVVTFQKSYLISLANWKKPLSPKIVGPIKVYSTEISLIGPGLTGEPDEAARFEGCGNQWASCKRQQRGIWVEEDGCVFKPLVCSSCRDFYVGVHIVAADAYNVSWIDKVAIFVDSVRFGPQSNPSEGPGDSIMWESLHCPLDARSKSADPSADPSPSKRTQITPPSTGKLKLRRRAI